ncbi:hypothetical protein [Vibrio campbellii]|uniref:hypothetical protein n=1 Tax=Vibrio campbellii TaxID=680 RepID=UPI00142DFF17|nr:hypothetical protein [Vibrio campbellii]NIY86087.1 hypothetical protein [Vibrio campbellii]NVK68168.1 hypothetical protein [Vibrio campbellii]
MEHILQLDWVDQSIPHKVWVEQYYDGCRICLKVVKDVEPEMLSLIVPNIDVKSVRQAWQGKAINVTPAYDDGVLFTQTRSLFNLPHGCVIWAVTHIKMQNGLKMSADKLCFVPKHSKQDSSFQQEHHAEAC